MELGMAPGLLFQIVSELRSKIPKILGDYKLTQAWAYKYVEDMDGINVHADDAAVNLNVWITPDDANLNPDDGGCTFTINNHQILGILHKLMNMQVILRNF